jgi:hypothetical protein
MMASITDSVMATASITNSALTGTAGSFVVPTQESGNWVLVEIAVTQSAWLTFDGTTATATNGEFWPAGMVKVKKCLPGSTISFIRDTTDGRITFGLQA